MRAFVTGADGFVGQWLLRALLADDAYVAGMIHGAEPALTTLPGALATRVQWRRGGITDGNRLRELLKECAPTAVYHLAAQSSVPASLENPLVTIETNVVGTVRLLEAVRAEAPDARVVVVGSADAYGTVSASDLPLREDAPLRPNNPYAASKAAAEILALQFARSGYAQAIATRSFNHTGPGQSPTFAIASFAKQLAEIKAGRQPAHLRVGDLSPHRDITDVRDVVDAYICLVNAGTVGTVYNVCSGHDVSIREIVNELVRICGVKVETVEDPALIRPVETPTLRGDPSRITADTGWSASIPLEKTLADLLEYYAHAA